MTCLRGTMFFWKLLSICAVIVVSAVGCGPSRPKTVPVTGVVTLDGKAVEGASVMLAPQGEGRPALGMTDKEGKFALQTFESGDGAILGKHQLTVRKVLTTGVQADRDGLSGVMAPDGIRERWIIPKKYSNPKEWDRTVEVEPGMEPLKLELTSR